MINYVAFSAFSDEMEKLAGLPRYLKSLAEPGKLVHNKALVARVVAHEAGRDARRLFSEGVTSQGSRARKLGQEARRVGKEDFRKEMLYGNRKRRW